MKIGISKFCDLRPKYCITVGSKGTHSVCVCKTHQNVKLIVATFPFVEKLTYHDLMEQLVCSVSSKKCMLHRCEDCPGRSALVSFLVNKFEKVTIDGDENIFFKQWVTTLEEHVLPLSEITEKLITEIEVLTTHHYIAKNQSAFLNYLKQNLELHEAIIILDFSENYSFVVQDAVQGFHWNNTQSTIHPIAIYYKEPNEDVCKICCMCVISDCMTHDAITVHSFIKVALKYLTQIRPQLSKLYYFTDGAASQYKNFKNINNLLYHERDFGLEAEWHFFATSHGKNACDGIGGTVKREASRASLKAVTSGQIINTEQLFEWCNLNIKGIEFFYVSNEEVESLIFQQEERFKKATKIPGVRSHHCYIPNATGDITVKRISEYLIPHEPTSLNEHKIIDPIVSLRDCSPGRFVRCSYDDDWWIGIIRETSFEFQDVLIKFMHPNGPSKYFNWPQSEDLCWIPVEDILGLIQPPQICKNGRAYQLS